MLLDLSEIVVREGMRVSHEVDQGGVEDPDLVFTLPLRGHLMFENSGSLLGIHGEMDTQLAIPCSRCLEEVPVPIHLDVDEHLPIQDVIKPDRVPDPDEEVETIVSTIVFLKQGRPILDLDELLRQLIFSEIPIRTLCNDDCRGLCFRCGANKNLRQCSCDEDGANRPLASLAVLLDQKDDAGS